MVFFGCLVFAVGYVWLMIPETKGLALEEVDALYKSKIPAWKSASWRPEIRRRAMDAVEGGGGRRMSDTTVVGGNAGKKDNVELGHVERENEAGQLPG